MPTKPILTAALALMLGACGTLPPADAPGISDVLGDVLPGAQGVTLADQERIDETVARGCAAGIFSRAACARHTAASTDRRRALRSQAIESKGNEKAEPIG